MIPHLILSHVISTDFISFQNILWHLVPSNVILCHLMVSWHLISSCSILSNIIVNFDAHVLVSTNDCSVVEVQ